MKSSRLLLFTSLLFVGCNDRKDDSKRNIRESYRPLAPPTKSPIAPTSPVSVPPQPGFTFFVTADTHFGFQGIGPWNRKQVLAMNNLPGKPYPHPIGSAVERPLGVLVAGDLTDLGKPDEWKTFGRYFGRTGKEGLLKYPVYLATGNHDRKGGRKVVMRKVRARHKGLVYSWDWHGVHFVCLDNYPSASNRWWLRKDLALVGRRMPVVIFFHYSILGPFSKWWSKGAKRRFRKTIAGYNVIAIFHGHYHGAGQYRWEGYDIYNVGSPMFYFASFAVVRITATQLTVVSWNYEHNRWTWHHRKKLAKGPNPLFLPRPRGP